MSPSIQPGRDSFVPVLGIHDADDSHAIRAETSDEIATITYDPENETDHDITHEVDRRIQPGESPGPDIGPDLSW